MVDTMHKEEDEVRINIWKAASHREIRVGTLV